MNRYLVIAGALAVALGGCAGGAGFDPISTDDRQSWVGVEETTIAFRQETGVKELHRTTGRNVENEHFKLTLADGTAVEWGVDKSENVDSHKARALLSEALGQNLENVSPEAADILVKLIGAI